MRYSFIVFSLKTKDNITWVAKSNVLKDCTGQGNTPYEAMVALEKLEKAKIAAMELLGLTLPIDRTLEILDDKE